MCHEQLEELKNYCTETEDTLIEAKMAWATLDLENDELTVKLTRKNE